ncbi:MAG: Chromosome partition protein Smc, partial [Chlamydiae bacterium]|nr:Chromosome partition protein Smc [Chlamydiota bacterium]
MFNSVERGSDTSAQLFSISEKNQKIASIVLKVVAVAAATLSFVSLGLYLSSFPIATVAIIGVASLATFAVHAIGVHLLGTLPNKHSILKTDDDSIGVPATDGLEAARLEVETLDEQLQELRSQLAKKETREGGQREENKMLFGEARRHQQELEQKITELEAALENSNAEKQEQLRAPQARLKRKEAALASAQEELATNRQKANAELERVRNELGQELETAKTERTRLETLVQTLQEAQAGAGEDRAELERVTGGELGRKTSELASLHDDIAKKETALASAREELATNRQKANAELERVKKELGLRTSELASLQDDIAEKETALA